MFALKLQNQGEKIMRHLLLKLLLPGILLFFGCSSISFHTDYDHEEDFGELKTFRFFRGRDMKGDALAKNPLLRKRIQAAVKSDLESKGFVEERKDSDFVIVLHAGVKDKANVTTWSSGYGWGYGGWRYDPWWGPGGGSVVEVSTYEEGTLVIDIVTGKKKEMIWRGLAEGIVKERLSPEEVDEAVAYIVTNILAEFPPIAE